MIEQDAREFGLYVRQGGWRLGLLVARNVERGAGDGIYRDHGGVATTTPRKVSAREFAERAGTSADRVLRYLDAWERAAVASIVPKANQLQPGDELDLDVETLPSWNGFYEARSTRQADAMGTIRNLPPERKVEWIKEQIKTDPVFASGAQQGLVDRHEKTGTRSQWPESPTPLDLLVELRKLHRIIDRVMECLFTGTTVVSGEQRDAVLEEIDWLRLALQTMESSLRGGTVDAAIDSILGE